MSEGAERLMDVDLEEAEDLPPHRAAIPVAPEALGSEHHQRRRNLVRMAVVFSLALHVGFFLAALIWGQGRPISDGRTALARVHLAQSTNSETVIEKAPASVAPPLDASCCAGADAPLAAPSAPAQQDPIQVQQPGPVSLTAHLEARIAAATEPKEQVPTPPDRAAIQADDAPAADSHSANAEISAVAEEQNKPGPSAAELGIPKPEETKPALLAYKPPVLRKKGGESSTSAVPGDDELPSPASVAGRSGSLFSYKRRVRAQVMRNLPEGRWGPGRVIVGFRISRSGALLGASVARSSGNAAMDRAALACVRAAGPFPAPPRGGAPGEIALSMDFRFQ